MQLAQVWQSNATPMPRRNVPKGRTKNTNRNCPTKKDKIGWKYAMRGYLSTSWVDMECYGKSGATPDSVRQNWLRPIIKAIWAFNKTMWTHQNSILHSTTIPLRELRESSVNSQIQSLYNQPATGFCSPRSSDF